MNARTRILDALLERISSLPEEAQVQAVEALLAIEARYDTTYQTSADERRAILQALAEADRGEFVPDEDMAAFFGRHRA